MSLIAYTSDYGQVILNGDITGVDSSTVIKLPHDNYLVTSYWMDDMAENVEDAFRSVETKIFKKDELLEYLDDSLTDPDKDKFFNQVYGKIDKGN